MELVQIRKIKNGEWVFTVEGRLSTPNVNNNEQGGIAVVIDKPHMETIRNKDQLHGRLNIFSDMSGYLDMTENIH